MQSTLTNYWQDDRCALAFQDQHLALPYQELLRDTVSKIEPRPGDRWLDLGCGSGHLTAALWQKSQAMIGHVTAMDCAAINGQVIQKLCNKLNPPPEQGEIQFVCGDFSNGLSAFPDGSFDGIVSGLAISYAESRDPVTGAYTDTAYTHLLSEMQRVLRPGGQLVFSVNVPEPKFWRILRKSLRPGVRISKPGRALINALRMQWYGGWLKREARKGRFHFFPKAELETRLRDAGFTQIEITLSYARQAYVVKALRSEDC